MPLSPSPGWLPASPWLKGRLVGLDPSAIPSSWRMSQALEAHTQPAAAGPHLALVQGMRARVLSQGGDSWALALRETGLGLLHIKNLLRKPSGMIPMFLPQ